MFNKRKWLQSKHIFVVCFLFFFVGISAAQEIPSPSKPIEILYQNLISIMKKSKELGINGRFDKLAPVLQNTYDVPTMAKSSVGRAWENLRPEQKSEIINAFSRMMIATYASRFNGYDGEYFEINEILDQAPSDKIIKTKIVPKTSKPVELNYIVRYDQNNWRIIDVYLGGTISEIATRRAEFSSILKLSGPEGLVASLQQQESKLLSSQ